jgi:hypothetical protein
MTLIELSLAHGIRGEWEGWAATVNLERTAAFSALVNGAEEMIPLLPWSKNFEKDKFLSPDFTSLEVSKPPGIEQMLITNIEQFRFSRSRVSDIHSTFGLFTDEVICCTTNN